MGCSDPLPVPCTTKCVVRWTSQPKLTRGTVVQAICCTVSLVNLEWELICVSVMFLTVNCRCRPHELLGESI